MDQILAELRAAEIPVEVLGLGGLLDLPEVLDTVAWLRVVADPGPSSNRWLARILMGPRCRIHYRDLAVLARWATKNTIQLAEAKRSGLPTVSVIEDETQLEPDDVALSLAEALDHLDEIEGLPPQARLRLAAVRDELAELASVSDGPLVELVQAVISRCGIGHALAASPRRDAAASQGNLTQFVGLVADFAPVAGEASLAEFLDYLDASEDADDSLELHVPSAEDSVKLTTVHRAKGLEFEVVFVPGVAARTNEKGQIVDSIFPDERTSNPATSFNQLPFGAREDRGHLPQPFSLDASGNRRPKKKIDFHEELKQRAVEDERRLFYVALTRAKQILYVTSAWWYERQNKPRGPSVFLTEVRAQPATTDLGESEMPAESPLMASLAAKAIWPPPAHPAPIGDEFPEGYAAALDELKAGRLRPDALLERLSEADRREARLLLAGHRKALAALTAPEIGAADGSDVQTRTSLSATQVAAAAKEPYLGAAPQKGMPWPPSSARRIGVEIHRWIEEQGRGLTGLADEAALDEAGRSVEPDRLKDLRNAFLEMGYGDRSPARLDTGEPMTELPFVLKLGATLIKGRIDVVYVDEAGGLEIVDFKSGAKVAADEMDQLMIYAAALDKLGISFGPSIKVTYCYLETRESITRELDTEAVRRGLVQLEQHLAVANPG